MPKGTPTIKVRNVARLGAKVALHGADFDEAKGKCARLAAAHCLVFVPPYGTFCPACGEGNQPSSCSDAAGEGCKFPFFFFFLGTYWLSACYLAARIDRRSTEILKQLTDAEHLDAVFGAIGRGLVAGICE
jgi:threonine dehydratase